MKSLKVYLIILMILTVIGLSFGVYVWYVLQTLGKIQDVTLLRSESNRGATTTLPTDSNQNSND